MPAATAEFIKLFIDRNGEWSYAEFRAVWSVAQYGEVDEQRWANKNPQQETMTEIAAVCQQTKVFLWLLINCMYEYTMLYYGTLYI